jgi:DNA-binding response OmpR family regulator
MCAIGAGGLLGKGTRPAPQEGDAMRVIVADDDRTCRRPLEAMLVHIGHEVIVCGDGTEAWQALQRDEVPQIALLDWMMPGMDGIDVCRKTREATRREPFA